MHRIMRLLCAQLAALLVTTASTTTKYSAARRIRYRGGETAQKKTLDDFLRHLGDGELATVWEKSPKLWRRVDGCGLRMQCWQLAWKWWSEGTCAADQCDGQ